MINLNSQAVRKMTQKVESGQRTTSILEIGDKGIKMVDKSKPGVRWRLGFHTNILFLFSGGKWSSLSRILLQLEKCHILWISSQRPQILWVYHKGKFIVHFRLILGSFIYIFLVTSGWSQFSQMWTNMTSFSFVRCRICYQ